MSKRKRDDEDESDRGGPDGIAQSVRMQRQRLEGVLERSQQSLFQALKLARGFERQKLGRRQKVAKAAKDDADGKRLAAEVAALKSLNLQSTAEVHLYKTLLKLKSIASAPAFPPSVETKLTELSKPQDAAHANVQARLFKSEPIRRAMDECIGNVFAVLGLDGLQAGKKKRLRKADYQQEAGKTEFAARSKDGGESIDVLGAGMRVDNTPENDDHPQDRDRGSDSSEDQDYEQYDALLAASSDGSFGGFSDFGELRSNVFADDMSVSLSSETSDSSINYDSPPADDKRIPRNIKPNSKATTFLPSLTMGGYWSGSEPASDNDEDDDDNGGPASTERKNRRGQRERRLIAEKKYGQNAKHLKQQSRDQGEDARKGAQANDARGKRGRGRGGRAGGLQAPRFMNRGAASSSGANSDPIGPRRSVGKPKAPDGPLHPSWQAAKVAKEQKKAAVFQGKKVVFD